MPWVQFKPWLFHWPSSDTAGRSCGSPAIAEGACPGQKAPLATDTHELPAVGRGEVLETTKELGSLSLFFCFFTKNMLVLLGFMLAAFTQLRILCLPLVKYYITSLFGQRMLYPQQNSHNTVDYLPSRESHHFLLTERVLYQLVRVKVVQYANLCAFNIENTSWQWGQELTFQPTEVLFS